MKRKASVSSFMAVFLLVAVIIQCPILNAEYQYSSKGKRDPFVPLITGEIITLVGLESVTTIDDIEFEGVIFDPSGKSMALLNGEVVKEGQTVYNVEVVKIAQDAIVIKIYDRAYTINLIEEGGETVER